MSSTGATLLALEVGIVVLLLAPLAPSQYLDQEDSKVDASRRLGRLYVVNEQTHRLIPLFPGLLDESLLTKGSFSFGVKTVSFDKLKVLGNIYVRRVNGRPLRESYLFRNAPGFNKRSQDKQTKLTEAKPLNEPIRVEIIS